MRKAAGLNFRQDQLEYGYKELVIPPGSDGKFLMDPNALHIWPRTTFMLIALPNMDGSFTCTFFFPFEGEESFKTLTTEQHVREFFKTQFPDAFLIMPGLVEDFFYNPTGAMVTVKSDSWHIGGKVALLGDAAHAIVPFFGQGMNCAFEDCTVLDGIIGDRTRETENRKPETGEVEQWWGSVFSEYEQARKINTDAIADLAVENFIEMRDLVATPKFQLKKKVEQLLQAEFPGIFIPKYSMVTFHRFPYSIALQRGKVQDHILEELCAGVAAPEAVDWNNARRLVENHLQHLPLPKEA
jgi:kynurenine 3-monooxygenase